jgi:RNA polymerase sigma-70 factor (ECF subfamily)
VRSVSEQDALGTQTSAAFISSRPGRRMDKGQLWAGRAGRVPHVSALSDSELLATMILVPDVTCAELYRRYWGPVYAMAHNVLGERPDCADITIMTFERLWLAPSDFDPARGTLVAYLRLEARSLSIDLLRAEARRRKREEAHECRQGRAVVQAEQEALDAVESGHLRHLVVDLPAAQREALELAFFCGMSYRAVAKHLGKPEGTVKTMIRLALQQLRREGTLASRS